MRDDLQRGTVASRVLLSFQYFIIVRKFWLVIVRKVFTLELSKQQFIFNYNFIKM